LPAKESLPASIVGQKSFFKHAIFNVFERKLTRFSTTLALLLSLILTACQTSSPVTPIPVAAELTPGPMATLVAPEGATATPVSIATPTRQATLRPDLPSGGTALVGLPGRLDSLNPITVNNAILQELTPLLFDSLLRVDPQSARLRPGLAQSWEYSADGRRVTFRLPDNLQWSDGTALTAADLAASLTATRHPALQAFSRIDAPGDDTLTLALAEVDCAAVTNLAVLPLLPSAEITATVPMGSGPFEVANWTGRSLTLTRNPTYWGDGPLLDELIVRLLDSNDDVPIALSEGQFDLIGPLQGPRTALDTAGFNELIYPAAQMIYLALNYDPKNGEPLPPKVRQAITLALDRPAILKELSPEDGQLLAGPLLPQHWAASADLSLPDYDPEQARQLLAQAGLRDTDGDGWLDQNGERLELGIRLNGQNRLHQNLGWLLSSYYRDIGLFVRAEGVAFDSVVDDLFTHDFHLAIFSWPILADPDQRLYWHSIENTVGLGLNFTSYHNPRLDELLEKGVAVPGCEPGARAETYGAMQKTLAEERPVDFLLAPKRYLLVRDNFYGVSPGPFAPYTWNATEWYIQGD